MILQATSWHHNLYLFFFHFPDYYFRIIFVIFWVIIRKSFHKPMNIFCRFCMSFVNTMVSLISISPNLLSLLCILFSCSSNLNPISNQTGLSYILSFMLSCSSISIAINLKMGLLYIHSFKLSYSSISFLVSMQMCLLNILGFFCTFSFFSSVL